MADPTSAASDGGKGDSLSETFGPPFGAGREPGGPEPEGQQGPVVRDRRKIDPQTGRVREAYVSSGSTPSDGSALPLVSDTGVSDTDVFDGGVSDTGVSDTGVSDTDVFDGESPAAPAATDEVAAAQAVAQERLADLQRVTAEFANYRRRVERDRDLARDQAVAGVFEALLPVLDDVHLARQHGDLEGGPFAAIAEKLDATLARLGLARYGEPGEPFDPTVHEALIHTDAELAEGTSTTTVVQVLQPGYRSRDKVLRAARVAVADPA
jgi:molecular chaperone GrpE